MNKVLKYPLATGANLVDLPEGHRLLGIIEHGNKAVLYALCPANAVTFIQRSIYLATTGETVDAAGSEYLGTISLDGGSYILHGFAR